MATTKRPVYLPDAWDNDVEMNGLMSCLKDRRINPINYDRVIDFWKNLISNYCIHEKTCLFSLDELKIKFRRGTQLPGPLSNVITELQKSSTVISRDELEKRNIGWIKWGFTLLNPYFWLSNPNCDFSKCRIVHLSALKKLAYDLLDYYHKNYDSSDDCSGIVAFDELRSTASHIINFESFPLVVDELIRSGEASIGYSKDGDRILKFKDKSTRGPAKFTESDANFHDIKKTMNRLEQEIQRAEQKMKMFKDEAKALSRSDKDAALKIMRKVARTRKELAEKDGQYQNLLRMIERLVQTKQNKEIIDVYTAGCKAFKEALDRHGLTPDKVDAAVEGVNEVMNDYHELEETIRDGFLNLPSQSDSVSDAELETELQGLLDAEQIEKKKVDEANRVRFGKRVLDIGDLPEVPAGTPSKSIVAETNGTGTNSISLEERWKRLRMSAN